MIQTKEFLPVFEISTTSQANISPCVIDSAILEAVDRAFQTLGNAGSEATYRFLQENYGLKKTEIPCKFSKFIKAIETIFGKAAILLEIRILGALHSQLPRFRLTADEKNFSLVSYVDFIRSNL